jgi:hypothetical protein
MILQIIMFVVQPQNMERWQVGSDAAGSVAGEFFGQPIMCKSIFISGGL